MRSCLLTLSFRKVSVIEILDECFVPDDNVATRTLGDLDLDALERKAFEITDNADFLEPETRAKARPSGRITIVDDKLRSKKTVGVAGVKMVANVFVKIATTYTDENGNYEFSPQVFRQASLRGSASRPGVGFSIGLNLILIPASISAIGKGSSTGIDLTIDKNSDATLFRRCVVNNAAYDYFKKCQATRRHHASQEPEVLDSEYSQAIQHSDDASRSVA